MFMSHDRLERFQGSPEVDSKIYDKVYDKEVDCSNLEEVYALLNINHPSDYRGAFPLCFRCRGGLCRYRNETCSNWADIVRNEAPQSVSIWIDDEEMILKLSGLI